MTRPTLLLPGLAALAVLAAAPRAGLAGEQTPPADLELRVERVARLCEAWTAAKFLHPALAYRDLDWDAAFLKAAPAAWNAFARQEYRGAAEGMLAVLEDPASHVREDPPPSEPFEPGDPPPLFRWPREGVLLVDVAGFQEIGGPYALYPAMSQGFAAELQEARAVVLDVRIPPGTTDRQDWSSQVLEELAPHLVPRELPGPTEHWLVHWGYPPQRGTSTGDYRTGFVSSLAPIYAPADPEAPERLVVFLANERTRLPRIALALQAAGTGKIVSEGSLSDARLVESVTVELGEGLEARIRATELFPPGGKPLGSDLELPRRDETDGPDRDRALQEALDLIETTPFEPRDIPQEGPPTPLVRRRSDASYPQMKAPNQGHRLLAGCRLWGTIRHFYPYLHLLDDWDGAFRDSLPELAAADGEVPYARAVLRLAAHVEDGHTGVFGHPGLAELRGEAFPPIEAREVAGVFAVTRIRDRAVQDLAVGDVIHAVDGTPLEERMETLWPLVTASREETRRLVAARWALAGPDGSVATLTVSGAEGGRREVTVRRGEPEEPVPPDGEGEPWHLLSETGKLRVGYVDLTRLRVPQVDPMLDALGDTDALVFDMRGYPHGTAWALAAQLNVRGERTLARFRRREVSHARFDDPESGHFFAQKLPDPDDEPYRGRTLMLLDERAVSQAEHTALAFEQAARTVFVGTPTAGANGDVTNLALPGAMIVSFTGHDVRHADGRQLQRVGIQPHIEASPTIQGLRDGRDEVLDRAVRYLREELAGAGRPTESPPPPGSAPPGRP